MTDPTRLSDERVSFYAAFESDKGELAREVQQCRALIPEVIEQLEAAMRDVDEWDADAVRAILARLREASQ